MPLELQHNGTAVEVEAKGTAVPRIRVVIADSQPIYRMGMKKIFALEDDIRVVAQVGTPFNLHAALEQSPVEVLLLEAGFVSDTIDAIPELMHRWPHTKVIVHVPEAKESNTVELYRYGIQGVIQRSIAPDLLVKCVRKVSEGETWIDNPSICRVIEAYQSQAFRLTDIRLQPKLSNKELAIISCLVAAMRNKEIAYQIGTTEQVIKNYLRKIYEKLGVSDRLELALYCLHHGTVKKYAEQTGKQAALASCPNPLCTGDSVRPALSPKNVGMQSTALLS